MTLPFSGLLAGTRSLRFGRHFALAIALASGTAMIGTLGFADTAHAQKKKKDKGAPKTEFSKEFVEAYQAIQPQIEAGADLATLRPSLDGLIGLANSGDEKLATGQTVFNAALKGKDTALQIQGLDLMLSSGKLPADQLGQFNYIGFQLSYGMEQPDRALTYLQAAIDNNFTAENVSAAIMKYQKAQVLISQGKADEGYDALKTAIAARKAEVGSVEQGWFGYGIKYGLDNQLKTQTYELLQLWLDEEPSKLAWRDSITIVRNMAVLDDRGNEEALLDLLRLAHKTGTLERGQDYLVYTELARPARYPLEVKQLIEDGFDSGAVDRGDTWVADQIKTAERTIASDRTELPATEAAANKPGATLAQVMNAARTFLSYGEYAKSVAFFEKALAMPDAPRSEVLQRMGMAQIGMGDHAGAIESFAKVDDARAPVAMLWSAYAKQQMNGMEING